MAYEWNVLHSLDVPIRAVFPVDTDARLGRVWDRLVSLLLSQQPAAGSVPPPQPRSSHQSAPAPGTSRPLQSGGGTGDGRAGCALARSAAVGVAVGALARLAPDFDKGLHQFSSDVASLHPSSDLRVLEPFVAAGCNVLVIAGWPCQPRSTAGSSRGRSDPRSAAFDHIVRFLCAIEQRWPGRLLYLLENVPVSQRSSASVREDEDHVRRFLPEPVVFDAAAVGSPTRRLRAYYTNLLEAAPFLLWLSDQRVHALPLADCLEAGAQPRLATASDVARNPDRNVLGAPLAVAPTVLSSSAAWTSDKELPPVLQDGAHRFLLAAERERALGYPVGYTAGFPDSVRCDWLGRAFDIRALRALFLFSLAGPRAVLPPARLPPTLRFVAATPVAARGPAAFSSAHDSCCPLLPSSKAAPPALQLLPAAAAVPAPKRGRRSVSRLAAPRLELSLELPSAAAAVTAARGAERRSRAVPVPRPLGKAAPPPPREYGGRIVSKPALADFALVKRQHPNVAYCCDFILDSIGATQRHKGEFGPLQSADCTIRALINYEPLPPTATPVDVRNRKMILPVFYLVSDDGTRVLGGEIDPEQHPIVAELAEGFESLLELPPEVCPVGLEHMISDKLSPRHREKMLKLLRKLEKMGVFTVSIDTLGKYSGPAGPLRFDITTTDLSKAYQRRRFLSPMATDALRTEVKKLFDAGLIEPSTSPVAANPLVVLKKDGTARVCIDYRDLNKITQPNRHPLPSIPALFHYLLSVLKSNIFSTLDLAQGFHQLPIAEDQRYLTAFYGPDNMLYQYTHMPFGIRNGPPEFQPRVQGSLRGQPAAVVFVDDVTIGTHIPDLRFGPPPPPRLSPEGGPLPLDLTPLSEDYQFDLHLADIEAACLALKKDGWTLKWQKCRWGYFVASQLGHYISSHGVQPMGDKIAAVNMLEPPSTVQQVRRFIGMANYYRAHVKDFSTLAAPLTGLLKKDVKFAWGSEEDAAFNKIKAALTSAPVLRPADFDKPFVVTCDWSTYGMGATLEQEDADGNLYVVEFWSKTCTEAEAKYGSFKGEAATLVYAAHHWRHYLVNGRVNRYRSDNSALQWLLTSPNLPAQAARWALSLQEMVFQVEHIAGNLNVVNDYLSRPTAAIKKPATVPWPTSAAAAAQQLAAVAVLTVNPRADARRPPPPLLRDPLGSWCLEFAEQFLLTALLLCAWGRTALSSLISAVVESEAVLAASHRPPLRPLVVGRPRISSPQHLQLCGFVAPALGLGLETPAAAAATPTAEIWEDYNTINYLRAAAFPSSAGAAADCAVLAPLSASERNRVRQRARYFFFESPDGEKQSLVHLHSDGTGRICPPPAERRDILVHLHSSRSGLNHLGVARTYASAARVYWWRGLHQDVASVVASCSVCDMQKARALPPAATLNPLPVRSIFFRLHSDLCGPFPTSKLGANYVMITVDSFTGALFLHGIPSKHAAQTARVAGQIIALLGAPGEWVTDNGGEWEAEFLEVLTANYVHPRNTSSYRPQSNGRAERSVQVAKTLLTRLLAEPPDGADFESLLPGIMLSYNCSKHKATGFAPYTLMYGRDVLVPAAARAVLREPIDPTDSASLLHVLRHRAAVLRHAVPMAAGNRMIAQARDSLQYARRRSGQYTAGLRATIGIGDPVYLVRHGATGLSLGVRRHILQVVMDKGNGVLRLQGRDGRCISEHRTNVAPCHLPDLDLSIDPGLARVPIDLACEICETDDTVGRSIILCSMCSSGWHWSCLHLRGLVTGASAPTGRSAIWYCPYCLGLRELQVPVDADGVAVPRGGRRRRASADVAVGSLVPVAPPPPPDLRRPSAWSLGHAPVSVGLRLRSIMPGDWSPAHVSRLAARIIRDLSDVTPSRFVATSLAEYQPLLSALDWGSVSSVWDPWAGLGSTALALARIRASVVLSDVFPRTSVPPLHALANALELSDVSSVCSRFGPFDGIVMSPWFELTDLAIAAALSAATSFLAVHVSHNYVFSAPYPRSAFLHRLAQEGRLLTISNLPRGGHGFRPAWLIIFASRAVRDALIRPAVREQSQALFFFSSTSAVLPPSSAPS